MLVRTFQHVGAKLPYELLHLSLLRLSSRGLHASARAFTESSKPFYVTTPIFYVNAEPHIGHLHSLVLADVLKRYRRLRDGLSRSDPILLTGTDEHGMKIQKAAQSKDMTPIELCDKVSLRFKALAEAAGADYDIFFRTTESRHKSSVEHVWRTLMEKGYIYKAQYEGWYCVSDETYYTPNQIRDEVAPDGTNIKVSIESGQLVEWMQEENYMFKLSAFQERLIEWLQTHPEAVQPRVRYNEVMSYLTNGSLGDLSISRPRSRLEWGIQVPDDPSHTIYVWVDALTNYLTATGYPEPILPKFWPADVHVVGKDIIRFHAVYWPAMLMALDLPLPGTVLAHAHWTMGQQKMSKSRGNVVNPFSAIDRFSKDGIRYFLMSRGGLESDSDFSEDHVARDYRKYLTGQAGNLVQRLQSKVLQRKLQIALEAQMPGVKDDATRSLGNTLLALPDAMDQAMSQFQPSKALEAIFSALAEVNSYLASTEPWKETDPASLLKILSYSIEGLRRTSILLQPFIPDSAAALLDRLAVSKKDREWTNATEWIDVENVTRLLRHIQAGGVSGPVFAALQDEKVEKLNATKIKQIKVKKDKRA